MYKHTTTTSQNKTGRCTLACVRIRVQATCPPKKRTVTKPRKRVRGFTWGEKRVDRRETREESREKRDERREKRVERRKKKEKWEKREDGRERF
jgi:hypothetical protein